MIREIVTSLTIAIEVLGIGDDLNMPYYDCSKEITYIVAQLEGHNAYGSFIKPGALCHFGFSEELTDYQSSVVRDPNISLQDFIRDSIDSGLILPYHETLASPSMPGIK